MKRKKGIAFLTTVMLLAIIVLICVGLSVVIVRDAYTVKRIRYATQAYFLAEAGAENAIRILYDNDFDTSLVPIGNVALGDGVYNITLTDHPTEDLVLIESTGTVKQGTSGETSKIVQVTVRDNSLEAFDYPVLCGGRTYVGVLSGVYGGDIRSNNHSMAWAVINWGWVDENVFAGGRLWNLLGATINGDTHSILPVIDFGTINGSQNPADPDVDMPPFDASFFNYYKGLAQSGGLYYSGNKTFDQPAYTPGNGVIFVNGRAEVDGNVTINGCLVATGQIIVNKFSQSSTFTQNQIGNLPALMTKGGNIEIYSAADINGLLYTSNRIKTPSFPFGTVNIDGTLMGKGGIYLYSTTRVDFVKQSPPGLPGDNAPLYIEHWSG